MPRIFTAPRLLLPVMIVMAMIVMALRVGDIWDEASSGRLFGDPARAEDTASKETPKAPAPKAEAAKTDAAPAPVKDPVAKDAGKDASKDSGLETLPSAAVPPVDEDVSPAEVEVLKQLAARREELDRRAKSLDNREAMAKIVEQRLDQKTKELEGLRKQLQAMVNQAGEQQTQQLDNLVKIYETMKPEDAAKIFEALDMPVLLNVIQRMKPKSTAPILARMAPEKAKEITVALTKQDQLPQVK